MTNVIKQKEENGYYVVMEEIINYPSGSYIKVSVSELYDNSMCGFPIKEMTYVNNDIKNACATYNRYIRKYCKGD